jgi:hypothetical protein
MKVRSTWAIKHENEGGREGGREGAEKDLPPNPRRGVFFSHPASVGLPPPAALPLIEGKREGERKKDRRSR